MKKLAWFLDDCCSLNVTNEAKAASFYTRGNDSKTNVSIKRSQPTLFANNVTELIQ